MQGVAEANQFALDMLVPLLDEVGIENFVVIANPQKALHAHLRAKELAPPDYRLVSACCANVMQTPTASGRAADEDVADVLLRSTSFLTCPYDAVGCD